MKLSEDIAPLGPLLDKLIRQIRLYGPEHDQTGRALKDLYTFLSQKLSEVSTITLSLRRTALLFEEAPILEITKAEGNYLQESFVDGVRSLTFSSGLEDQELLRFCQVLGRDFKTYELQEEDTVTLLWKLDLNHIMYETVDVYAGDRMVVLQSLMGEEMDETEEEKEKREYLETFVSKLLHPPAASLGEPGPIGLGSTHHVQFQKEVTQPVPREYFYWDSDIEAEFQELTNVESEKDLRPAIATIFSEILEDSSEDEFPELCRSYTNRIRDFFFDGDIAASNDWLRRLRAIQSYLGSADPEIYEAVEDSLQDAFDTARLETLNANFVEEVGVKPDTWMAFFQYLGPKNLQFTGKLLEFFHQETFHNMAVEIFKTFHYRYAFHFREFLASSNILLVRDGVRLLSPTLDDEAFRKEMSKYAIHPRREVRLEVLKALRGRPEELRAYFLRRGIEDQDEKVRLFALKELFQAPVRGLAKALAMRISSEEFLQNGSDEKRMALQALAKSGAADANSFILQIVQSSDQGSEALDLQVAAIHALASIPSRKTQEVLENLLKKRFQNKNVKEAVRSTLDRMAALPKESGD